MKKDFFDIDKLIEYFKWKYKEFVSDVYYCDLYQTLQFVYKKNPNISTYFNLGDVYEIEEEDIEKYLLSDFESLNDVYGR